MVIVKYLGGFSLTTGKIREEIEISDNEDIRNLLTRLRQNYGRKFERSLDNPMTLVWVNGAMTYNKDMVLHHGDKLIIGTLVGGG